MPRSDDAKSAAAGPKPAAADPGPAAAGPKPAADRPPPTADPALPSSPAAGAAEITVHGRITDAESRAVLELVRAAAEEDGVGPLSEHVMLHLRYGGDPRARNLLLVSHGELAGYAHLDPTDPVEGPSGELVIHPAHRRQELGLLLTRALVAEAGERPLRLWAHGDLPAAARLAAAAGFERIRALWQMRRSLQSRLDRPQVADGVTIRTFVIGQDEDAWTDLNARAFARHPEQGAWTREDLDLREREPWFDPNGFFLAERAGKLVGFHWTKIHGRSEREDAVLDAGLDAPAPHHQAPGQAPPAGQASPAEQAPGRGSPAGQQRAQEARAHEPIGEVYVVGVSPEERGTGLGRALTLVGLRYLRSQGLFQVMLYVDESNTPAIGLYESLGFTHWDTDVMYLGGGAS
jgi:mycothiol synthase